MGKGETSEVAFILHHITIRTFPEVSGQVMVDAMNWFIVSASGYLCT